MKKGSWDFSLFCCESKISLFGNKSNNVWKIIVLKLIKKKNQIEGDIKGIASLLYKLKAEGHS